MSIRIAVIFALAIVFPFHSYATGPRTFEFSSINKCAKRFLTEGEGIVEFAVPLMVEKKICPEGSAIFRFQNVNSCNGKYCDTFYIKELEENSFNIKEFEKDFLNGLNEKKIKGLIIKKNVFFYKTHGGIVLGRHEVCNSYGCFSNICANTYLGATLFKYDSLINFYRVIENDTDEVCGYVATE